MAVSNTEDFNLEKQADCFSKLYQEKMEDHHNTPELFTLTTRGSQLLFVAGNLKETADAQLNADLLGRSVFVGTGFTTQRFYSMWAYNEDYPILIQEPTVGTPYKAKVYGEVYLVSASTMAAVDYFEERGDSTIRTKTQIFIPKPFGIKFKGINAWCHTHTCRLDDWKEMMANEELERVPLYHNRLSRTDTYYVWKSNNKKDANAL